MTRLQRLESKTSTRAMAGLLSAMLHLGLLVLISLSGGRGDGAREDPGPATQAVLLDAGVEARRPRVEPVPDSISGAEASPDPVTVEPPGLATIEPAPVPSPTVDIPQFALNPAPPIDVEAPGEVLPTRVLDTPAAMVMPRRQASALLQRIEKLAEQLTRVPRARATWQQDGRRYEAELALEPAPSGVEPDRVVAEISAEDQGRQLRTLIKLKRLPFSHYAQVINRWDPMVQLHDDEIVGRMHINSSFNVLYDSQAAPRLLGKVSTAASGFNLDWRGRRRDSGIFHDGIETRAGRIQFAEQGWSFERARYDPDARVHELAGDTRIRFRGDGGYSWHDRDAGIWQHGERPHRQSVYFMAARGVSVYVEGVVSGKFLVYSPQRIVVEGDLTYARDPRSHPDSGDYLGLVCDRDIEIAPAHVTGPGDLHLQAALFARRRVLVRDSDHPRSNTLYIFGSLAAGTLTESEPRYATKVEYDRRFDRLRPPDFPSTNRFAAEEWDREWALVPSIPEPDGS